MDGVLSNNWNDPSKRPFHGAVRLETGFDEAGDGRDGLLLRSAAMCPFPQSLRFLVVAVAGWINQQQRDNPYGWPVWRCVEGLGRALMSSSQAIWKRNTEYAERAKMPGWPRAYGFGFRSSDPSGSDAV